MFIDDNNVGVEKLYSAWHLNYEVNLPPLGRQGERVSTWKAFETTLIL